MICNGYMYDTLNEIASHAQLKIILNAVEKGSNPWGCTDYLNQKKKILNTGADVYELMNEVPVPVSYTHLVVSPGSIPLKK